MLQIQLRAGSVSDLYAGREISVSDPYHFDADPDPDPDPRIRIRDDGSGS